MRTIAAVFEGHKPEKTYFNLLKERFFDSDTVVEFFFQNDVYELYKLIEEDEDIDIVALLANRAQRLDFDRELVSEVYMFFDAEMHDDQYSPANTISMLKKFNNETEFGKLYLSYPMSEALRDGGNNSDLVGFTIETEDCKGKKYKEASSERAISKFFRGSIRQINDADLKQVLNSHLYQASHILGHEYFDKDNLLTQTDIFETQEKKWRIENRLYVLSAFPLFLHEYNSELIE